MKSNRKGFSLIELLVVVAIIGVLAAVGIVGYQKYIDSAKEKAALANAQNIYKALSAVATARSGGLHNQCEQSTTPVLCAIQIAEAANLKNPYNTTQRPRDLILGGSAMCQGPDSKKGLINVDSTADSPARFTSTLEFTIYLCLRDATSPETSPDPAEIRIGVITGF